MGHNYHYTRNIVINKILNMVVSITYRSTCFSLIIVKGFVVLTQSCISCLQGIRWVFMTINFRLQIIDIYCCGYCWQTNYSRNQKWLLEEYLSIIKTIIKDSKMSLLDYMKLTIKENIVTPTSRPGDTSL